jgi:hypothetical protein
MSTAKSKEEKRGGEDYNNHFKFEHEYLFEKINTAYLKKLSNTQKFYFIALMIETYLRCTKNSKKEDSVGRR